MKKKDRIGLLALGLCLGTMTVPLTAQAAGGELFPPQNVGACGFGTALVWVRDSTTAAHLECHPVSSKIDNKTCPTGQIARSVNGNVVACYPLKSLIDVDACPEGQVVQEIRDGQGVCVPNPLNIACQSNQVLRGISANGQPVCVERPSFVTSCATGTFIKEIKSSGSVICDRPQDGTQTLNILCPDGYIMTGVQNNQPVCSKP